MSNVSDISLSSDESDNGVRQIRFIRDRKDLFEMLNDVEFRQRFRFSKITAMKFLHQFDAKITPTTNRNKSISVRDQLLIALRFYATGAFQQVIGDHTNVHKSTVCRIVKRMTEKIAGLKGRYINMPTGDALTLTKQQFYMMHGFPRVLGAIDCTHIKIQSPGGDNAELFRNRKGYFSINVQVVCNANLVINHIIARWPGSVHDSTIFNDSPLCAELEAGRYGNSFLLGDSGYACKPYLLTPFLNPYQAQGRYNAAHIATRNVVEQCFGVLKKRFPCLMYGLRTSLDTTVAIIVACSVLHNFALQVRGNMDDDEVIVEELANGVVEEPPINARENGAVRNALVETVFRVQQ